MFKKTVLAVYRRIKEENLPVKIVFPHHDAIWFTCPKDDAVARKARAVIQDVMEHTVWLDVPMKVEWQ